MFATVTNKAGSVLKENRGVVNFKNYVTSEAHKVRMKTFPKRLQIPRSQWFQHKNWPGRMHMPPYHVHFRQDMQDAIKTVVRSFQTPSLASRQQSIKSALRIFQSGMRSLTGHVGLEERAVFPMMVRANPDVNLDFLWEDHKELHEGVDRVVRQMRQLIHSLTSAKEEKTDKDPTASTASGDLRSLPIPYLKAMLEAANVSYKHCTEVGDLQSLLAKHEAEVVQEMKAALRLSAISTKTCVTKADVALLYVRRVHQCQGVAVARSLKALLEFDQALLTHLGEEEETVVPMELQDKQLRH